MREQQHVVFLYQVLITTLLVLVPLRINITLSISSTSQYGQIETFKFSQLRRKFTPKLENMEAEFRPVYDRRTTEYNDKSDEVNKFAVTLHWRKDQGSLQYLCFFHL